MVYIFSGTYLSVISEDMIGPCTTQNMNYLFINPV